MSADGNGRVRPYRLHDVNANADCRWRCYTTAHNAHDGALREMKWRSPPGRTIDIVNVDTKRALLRYVRHVDGIKFYDPKEYARRARSS